MEFHFFQTPRCIAFVMPKASNLQLMQRIRREGGFIQIQLAEKTGIVQTLVSDYERRKLRLNADMISRFAASLKVSTDALPQLDGPMEPKKSSGKVSRRLEQMEALPVAQQAALPRTIDTFLEGAAARAARTS